MRLSYSRNYNSDIWFAVGDQKMCMWAKAIGLGADFVWQGVSYGRLHSEENNWNEDFPYTPSMLSHTPHLSTSPSSRDGCSGL